MLNTKHNVLNKNGVMLITFPEFEKYGVASCFTTRIGGVSEGKYSGLNMSFSNGDSFDNVLENFKRVCFSLDIDHNNLVFSHQTHTKNLMVVKEDDVGKGIVKERDYDDIDGLITNMTGVALVTQFADCVPLLFFDPKKRVIAASHAGWKGTVLEIGKETVLKMSQEFESNPQDILVVIAPSICQKCYEVDDLVINELNKINYLKTDDIYYKKPNGKYQLNLHEANRQILMNAGIKSENITVTDLCTNCHPDLFHSHRATKGERGNNAAIICMK